MFNKLQRRQKRHEIINFIPGAVLTGVVAFIFGVIAEAFGIEGGLLLNSYQ